MDSVRAERNTPDRSSLLTSASIRGAITAIDSAGRIRIEESPAEDSGSAKAVVRITPDTRIVDQNGKTRPDALSVGLTVSVWYIGPVAPSYPAQATASVILIR